MRHLVGYFLVSSALVGCSLSTVGSMNPTDGEPCDKAGATETAKDDCTVCTCDGKTWSCDSSACPTSCKEGDMKQADDGCNECSCDADGKWDCTSDLKCGQGCKEGEMSVSTDGCTTCVCASDGTWDCKVDDTCGGGMEKCKVGEETHDDCMDCVCNEMGTWSCSGFFDGNCGTPMCKPGEVRKADDDCNTCTCLEDGQWACTLVECGPTCPAPQMASNTDCKAVTVFAQDPATGLCCKYGSYCEAPATWKAFSTLEECDGTGGMVPLMCEAGTADCDADPANGCETDLMESDSNCGACFQTCFSPAGEMGTCELGKCTFEGGAPPTCVYLGVTYSAGDSFPDRDGCNTCGCLNGVNGSELACTDRACACQPQDETYRDYVVIGKDCEDYGTLKCPGGAHPFANDCGCGCEQGTDCPISYRCAADGTDMLCATLPTRCPYTTITPDLQK